MFDIKSLFAGNYPQFVKKHPILTALVVKTAAFLWMEKRFQIFQQKNANLHGGAFLTKAFEHINFSFVISDEDLSKIPKTGRLIIVANHPMGNLDGIGLIQVLSTVRPDIKLLVGKALHVMLGMQDLTIPVDHFSQKLSKQSFKTIHEYLDNEGAIVLFPAGMYSNLINGEVIDRQWKGSFLRFALEKNAPVLPIYIDGKNSRFYYWLIDLYENYMPKQKWMRDVIQMKMMREIFSRHTNDRVNMLVGDLLAMEKIDQQYQHHQDKINAVRTELYNLKNRLNS